MLLVATLLISTNPEMIVRRPRIILAVATAFLKLLLAVRGATELSVTVYDGPKDCGASDKVKPWDHIEMHYVGTIDASSEAGTPHQKIDSSRDRGETFGFQIGGGNVIDGWDEGIVGLCKGAKANLVIPPALAYDDKGVGDGEIIPPGATVSGPVFGFAHACSG